MTDPFVVSLETLTRLGRGDPARGRRTLRAMIDLEVTHEPVNGPTSKPENVRAAGPADEPGILDLLRLDVAENATHIAPLSEARLLEFVQAATRDQQATIGVIGPPERIEGMVYLTPERWWWGDEWYLAERVTIVHPRHRTSRHAADLLRFARWFVDEMSHQYGHQVYLIGSVVATQDARRKTALFGRLMNFAGGVFCYPNPAVEPDDIAR